MGICLQPSHLDWTNLKNDRAKAAYENFHGLDGQFADNVILQIKYGPIDFQVREPVSPLLGALHHTNQVLELQITQEYTGQQRHVCYLVPMWKQILDFDLHANGGDTPVSAIVGQAKRSIGRWEDWLCLQCRLGRELDRFGSSSGELVWFRTAGVESQIDF